MRLKVDVGYLSVNLFHPTKGMLESLGFHHGFDDSQVLSLTCVMELWHPN